MAATNLPTAVSGNTFNADNEMTAFNGTALAGACPERSRRNANGNLTNDRTNTYTWDVCNHLSPTNGAVNASFVYGAFGRRMTKTINGTTRAFLYDGLNPVQELQNSSPSAHRVLPPFHGCRYRGSLPGAAHFKRTGMLRKRDCVE
jgi:hypothetical protein